MSTPKISLLFLILLSLIGQGSITVLVPGLPEIATSLHVRNPVAAQLVSAYLLGIAITSLIIGALSDRFGRKKIIIAGSLIYTLSSLISIILNDINYLTFLRVTQALGGGALLIMSHAIVTDCYTGHTRTKILSIIYPLVSISPLIGMFIGGITIDLFQWKSIYVLSFCCGTGIFIYSITCFQETLNHKKFQTTQPTVIARNYWHIVKHPVFIGYTILNCLTAAIIYSYFADAPFILRKLRFSAVAIGYLIASTGFGIIIGNFICHKALDFLSFNVISVTAIIIITLGTIYIFATTSNGIEESSEIILPFFIMSIGIGIFLPLLVSKVSHTFESVEGSALGLYNFFRAIACAATTRYVGEFTLQDPYNMSIFISIFVILLIISSTFLYLVQPKK